MRFIGLIVALILCGCVPSEDRTDFYKPPIDRPLTDARKTEPEGWIKHDARDCKFSFGQDVVIAKGFYRGRTGAVMELREDGYVVDVYGYKGVKERGQIVDRRPVVYGVPESHLELDTKDSSVR